MMLLFKNQRIQPTCCYFKYRNNCSMIYLSNTSTGSTIISNKAGAGLATACCNANSIFHDKVKVHNVL